MNYTEPTEETKEALHIGSVSESTLYFNEENGYGTLQIRHNKMVVVFSLTLSI